MKYNIIVENSAPSQGKPAKSVIWASILLSRMGVKSIVDLGCGRLRNLPIMRRYFKSISLVDTNKQCERISSLYQPRKGERLIPIINYEAESSKSDAIYLISVLHVIDKPDIRRDLLRLSERKLKVGGYLIIDVPCNERYYRQKCTDENKFGDGWVMGIGKIKTFYKNYTAAKLDALIKSCTEFELFDKVYFDKHIIRIYQKR